MIAILLMVAQTSVAPSVEYPAPQWIWDAGRPFGEKGFFRREFDVQGRIRSAWIQTCGDDRYALYLNGGKIASGGFSWEKVDCYDVSDKLEQGRNLLAATCLSPVDPAGFILRLTINYEDRPPQVLVTDSSWRFSRAARDGWEQPGFDDSSWGAAVPLGEPPVGPWGPLPFSDLVEDGARLQLISTVIPDEARAGETISLIVTVRPDRKPGGDYPVYLSVRSGRIEVVPQGFAMTVRSSTWRAGAPVVIGPIDLPVSRYVPTGTYELRLGVRRLPYTRPTGVEPVLATIAIEGREGAVKPPETEVRDHNGSPAVWIDGRPVFAMVYSDVGSPSLKHAQQFGGAGVHLYEQFSAGSLGWSGPGKQDFGSVDHSIMTLLEGDPDAYFFPRTWVEPPSWWLEAHPEEMAKYAAISEDKIDVYGGTRWPSMASELWKREAGEAFRNYIRHIQNSPYADRVIGYHIGAGIYGEWHYMGSQYLPDTGQPMTGAFRRWLRREYKDDVSALRKAWGDPRVTFETAEVPGKDARFDSDFGIFRDPSKSRWVIDYYRCHHEVLTDAIIHFARIVKEESEGRSLVGVFYGYTSNVLWPQEGGHWNLHAILDSPHVDFLCSPHSYVGRLLGQDGGLRALPASIRLHGKFFMDESDDRSHLAPETRGFKIARNFEETVAVMRREFANALTQNFGQWWFDMDSCWFEDDRVLAEITAMQKAGERSMELPRKSVAEIAVFVGEDSIFYVTNWMSGRDKVTDPMLNEQWRELFRMGAPFDLYELKDLTDPKFPEYKCYVFLNCFYVPREVRRAVNEKLKRDGKVLVWMYAPGLIDDDGLAAGKMEELTGIRLSANASPSTLETVPGGSGKFGSLVSGKWGVADSVSPSIWVDDSAAAILGRNPTSERANFCVKEMPGWTSVYAPGPTIPSAVLRKIARLAGCHIYSESDDPFYCNWSYLAMHAAEGGKKAFHLPGKFGVRDALTGESVSRDADRFSVEMERHETRLFEIVRH